MTKVCNTFLQSSRSVPRSTALLNYRQAICSGEIVRRFYYWDLAVRQSYSTRLLIEKIIRTAVSCNHMVNEGSLPVGCLPVAVDVDPEVRVLGHVAQAGKFLCHQACMYRKDQGVVMSSAEDIRYDYSISISGNPSKTQTWVNASARVTCHVPLAVARNCHRIRLLSRVIFF